MNNKKRRDFGKLRISQRDLEGLDWIATMGAVRIDALAKLFSIIEGRIVSVEASRKVVRRWVSVGWAEQQTFLKGVPAFVWLTRKGMEQTQFKLPAEMPALSTLIHTSDLSFIRLDAQIALPEAVWRSEREIRNIASGHYKAHNFPHIPDGEVFRSLDDIVAIERERTAKTVDRTRNIMLQLCSRKCDYSLEDNSANNHDFRYAEIFYYVSRDSINVVEKAKTLLPANFQKRIKVILW